MLTFLQNHRQIKTVFLMLQLQFSFFSHYNFVLILWLGLDSKITWLGLRKTSRAGLKYGFCPPPTQLEIARRPP